MDLVKILQKNINREKTEKKGENMCKIFRQSSNVRMMQQLDHASKTQIFFASFMKKPLAIKIFVDVTKPPRDISEKDWKKIVDREYPEKSMLDIYGVKYEARVYMKVILPMIEKRHSPNFVRPVGFSYCDSSQVLHPWERETLTSYYSAILKKYDLKVGIMITNKVGGKNGVTLGDVWDNLPHSEKQNMVFQLVYSIGVMTKYRLIHNDLHPFNIVLRILEEPKTMLFLYKNKKFAITTRYVPFIFDWDRSFAESLGDNKFLTESFCASYNACNVFNKRGDLYKILCYLKFPSRTIKYYSSKALPMIMKSPLGDNFSIEITPEEKAKIEEHKPYYGKFYKMSRIQLGKILSPKKMEEFDEATFTIYFYLGHSELIIRQSTNCNLTIIDEKFPTPEELLDDHELFRRLETKEEISDFDPNFTYKFPEKDIHASIYIDSSVNTRHLIEGTPRFPRPKGGVKIL